jgi:hypothetical protein
MSDSEDSDTEFPFDRIEPKLPICVGVDPNFCKLAFLIKQTLYNDIMYHGSPESKKSQSTDLNDTYETTIGIIHGLFMNLFRQKQSQNTGIPQEIEKKLPANLKDKITELYNKCYEQANNADREQLETYQRLINNLFHTYVYDMGTQR